VTLSTREVTLWVLLALIAATLGLIFAVSHMSHSVWYDESLTDIIARQPTFGGLVKSAMDLKAYPPAFFAVVRWVYSVDDSPDGMRLPSAVFGFLATLAVFALGRIAGGSVVGALAGAFFVLTPGALRYFSDGNAYTLLMLASAVSTVCLYRALETDRRLHWILYGASAALGLATHTIFVFHLGGQILAALWCRFVVKPNGTHRPPTGPMRMMLTMSVLLVLWLAWVAFYTISGGMTRVVSLSAIWSPAMLLAVPGMYAGPLSFGTLLPLALWLLLQLAGAVALFLKRRRVFLFLLILTASSLLAICLFIKATLSYFAYRYGLGLFPIACVIAACSIGLPPTRLGMSPRMTQTVTLMVAAAYLVAGGWFLARAGPGVWDYQAWDEVSALLARETRAGDAVIVQPSICVTALQYYYKGPAVMYPPRWIEGWSPGPEELTASIARKHRTAWLVLSSFENPSSFVSSFTERPERRRRVAAGSYAARIERAGCLIREAKRFLRVTVIGFECLR
jgi:hypothetical protein